MEGQVHYSQVSLLIDSEGKFKAKSQENNHVIVIEAKMTVKRPLAPPQRHFMEDTLAGITNTDFVLTFKR